MTLVSPAKENKKKKTYFKSHAALQAISYCLWPEKCLGRHFL